MKNKRWIILWVLACNSVFSQIYKREIQTNSNKTNWKYIPIVEQMYAYTTISEKNIRIKNVYQDKVTEIPFILSDNLSRNENIEVVGQIRNKVVAKDGYYYTILNDKKYLSTLNEIQLFFKNSNFDWKIRLEGSNDGKEWFTILNDYRILRYENEQVSYSFAKLNFGIVDYQYYRLRLPQDQEPVLEKVVLGYYKPLNKFTTKDFSIDKIYNNTEDKTSVIDFSLGQILPIYAMKMHLYQDKFYNRNFDLYKVISQDNQTRYQHIFSNVLSSESDNYFVLGDRLVGSKFRIIIENKNNLPISFNKIELETYQQGIIFEAKLKGDYWIEYNDNYGYPDYDLVNFKEEILTQNFDTVHLGEQQEVITSKEENILAKEPSKYWMWALLGVIIIGLGYFSLKIINDKSKQDN